LQALIARPQSGEADTIKRSHQGTQENSMNQSPRPNEPQSVRPLLDEADIGSGEKTPAQKETEEIIRQIPPLPASESPASGGNSKPGAPNQP
jgi:hypothetical protein